MTDQQARELLKSSPQKAHRLIFDEYYNYVYTIVFNRLRSSASREDIDECVSDVFSDVFRHYSTEHGYSGDIKGYIAAIARNRAVDMFRRLRAASVNTVPIDGYETMRLAASENITELAERAETCHALLDAVKSLGEPDCCIIMQKYYYGRSSANIADKVGMKPEAVRKRLSRAMDKLRKILTDNGEGR
ncbi:sigma-70 family RNA polymerase sigma factor [Ruminococcus sp.]|uniref:sigma-70 family RNA polymerase sigma factor n=1 Tax=Ruminococcus sp. TaxID=41978 RepID=UPI0025F6A664|nr:sigma-70 family RNA polymerase sigma factor [Ruminococcus sp.]MCR4639432.1 sigma-70 family RNA polymerase sigma factor [Ruminococcus sp.]